MTVLLHSHPWDAPGDPDTVGVHWSMWSTRQWPYLHLNEGDHYFTVTGGSPREGWIQGEARIEHLVLTTHEETRHTPHTHRVLSGCSRRHIRQAIGHHC
jgi:hypothetical protein